MALSVSVITKVPANQIQPTMQAFGPGFSFDVRPDGFGTFTVTATPLPATQVPAPAGAATQTFPALAAATAMAFVPGAESDTDYTELIALPPKSSFNVGLASAGQHRLREILGEPILGGHYDLDGHCKQPDNPALLKHLVLQNFGNFKATGVDVAIEALKEILGIVRDSRPRLFGMLGTEGMECARFTKVNGNIGPGVSVHSWGMAIDLTIGGHLDAQGDSKVLRGSFELSHFFNAAGWYWGAGFPTEDGMHFEASASLIEQWKSNGRL